MTLDIAATMPLITVSETAPGLSTEASTLASTDYVAYVGIDWADRKHDIALYDCATETWEEYVIQSRPQDILDWVNKLRARYGTGKIAVALEQKRGPLLYALCQYDNLVLFPINPRTVANYRKAFQPSRAKSDPVDARLLVELMQKHGDKLEVWKAGCPKHRALRQWVESRRMLVGEKVRLTNRITASLKSYFPQVLDWFEDKDTFVFCAFIEQFSDVKAAQAASADTLTQFFRTHHAGRRSAIARRIQQIQDAGPPLTEDDAIVIPAKALTVGLIALLKVVLTQLSEFNQQIAELFETLPDAELFQSLPGAGPHLAPRLLAAFGEDRSRSRVSDTSRVTRLVRALTRHTCCNELVRALVVLRTNVITDAATTDAEWRRTETRGRACAILGRVRTCSRCESLTNARRAWV